MTYDQLEKKAESLKNSIFIINDLLNLTRFNLDNIPQDLSEKQLVIDPVINEASRQILQEEEKTDILKNAISELIDNSLDEVFDKLSAYKIPSTMEEYLWFIREYKSKEAKKLISIHFGNIINLF